jgi:hypothetical protein
MPARSASDAAYSINTDIADSHFFELYSGTMCLAGIRVHLNNSSTDRKTGIQGPFDGCKSARETAGLLCNSIVSLGIGGIDGKREIDFVS